MTDYSKNPMTGTTVLSRVGRWWRTQLSSQHREKAMQGALGVTSFAALILAMPLIAGVNAEQQNEEQFRDRSIQLAEIRQDDVEVSTALDHKSALLGHDWLRFVEISLERDPSSALSPYAAFDRDQAAINSLVRMDVPKRADAEEMLRQNQCLATAIYYEARSEALSGQLGVAEVIVNRVNDHRYPNTICDVVFQGATRTTGCQFTFTCDGAMNKDPRGKRWEQANSIAAHVMMGLNERKTAGATHYHATYVDPVWNSGLIKTRKIGTHIFYRFPRGGEWSVASARQSARLAQRRAGLKAVQPAPALSVSDLNGQALKTVQADASVQSAVATEGVVPPAATEETAANVSETTVTTAAIDTTLASQTNSTF